MTTRMIRIFRNGEDGQGGGGNAPQDHLPPQGQGQQGQPQGQGQQSPEGYPANTRVADMTVEQQAAYWKAQSRKHEERANQRQDYDDVVKERDELRKKQETEQEKSVREAREAAVAEERQANNNRIVKALIEGALKARDAKDDDIAAALKHANFAAFLDDKGEVDHDAIISYAGRYASTSRGPDFGQGRRGSDSNGRPGQQGLERAMKRYPEIAAK